MENFELIKKIVLVIKEMGAVKKTGFNKFMNYSYRSHEDIVNSLHSALLVAEIAIIPKSKKVLFHEPGYILLECVYSVTDGKESIDFVGIGEGIDKTKENKAGDKAAYKAQTGAIKYALNDLLMLASELESENENADEKSKTPILSNVPVEKQNVTNSAFILTEKGTSEIMDLMVAMNYDSKRQELVWQKVKIVGEQKAIEGLKKAYEDSKNGQ